MKKLISLAFASLAVATFIPVATQAQTSTPANPSTAPNLTPVTPSNSDLPDSAPLTPGNNTAPMNKPGTPSKSSTPSTSMPETSTPTTSTPTTSAPSAELPGTCGAKISSATMAPSGGGMMSSTANTANTTAGSYNTSTSSSNVPLMKLNTNPTITAPTTTATSASTSYSTSTVENASRLLDASSDEIEHNNLIGPAHYIKLSVGISPLCYLTLTPLQEVYSTNSIKVLDASGKSVPAVVTKQDNGSAKISFDQPISAGSSLVLALQGVEYGSTLTPTTVQYYISGGFANYSQEIPYGVAQVQRYVK